MLLPILLLQLWWMRNGCCVHALSMQVAHSCLGKRTQHCHFENFDLSTYNLNCSFHVILQYFFKPLDELVFLPNPSTYKVMATTEREQG
jgi:hypothetical protein